MENNLSKPILSKLDVARFLGVCKQTAKKAFFLPNLDKIGISSEEEYKKIRLFSLEQSNKIREILRESNKIVM